MAEKADAWERERRKKNAMVVDADDENNFD
jgi:hypothetical protein